MIDAFNHYVKREWPVKIKRDTDNWIFSIGIILIIGATDQKMSKQKGVLTKPQTKEFEKPYVCQVGGAGFTARGASCQPPGKEKKNPLDMGVPFVMHICNETMPVIQMLSSNKIMIFCCNRIRTVQLIYFELINCISIFTMCVGFFLNRCVAGNPFAG